jgi:hypothetical protein
MRHRPVIRAASVVLALVMTLAGLHAASAKSCVDDDCDMPCCDRDADQQTLIPVFPCCRTVSIDQAAPHCASTTVESDRSQLAAPLFPISPAPVATASAEVRSPTAQHLPAPPLYHRNCALLL